MQSVAPRQPLLDNLGSVDSSCKMVSPERYCLIIPEPLCVENCKDPLLNESGIIKNTVSQNNNSKANSSNLEQNNSFGLWLSNLTDRQIIEVRELQDAGWTEDEIHLAFNSKYSTT